MSSTKVRHQQLDWFRLHTAVRGAHFVTNMINPEQFTALPVDGQHRVLGEVLNELHSALAAASRLTESLNRETGRGTQQRSSWGKDGQRGTKQ